MANSWHGARRTGAWMYLVAFLDWYSRYVVAWPIGARRTIREISESLELPFVLDCCEEALEKQVPEIVNSDQGSHFTSERFTSRFLARGRRVSACASGSFSSAASSAGVGSARMGEGKMEKRSKVDNKKS